MATAHTATTANQIRGCRCVTPCPVAGWWATSDGGTVGGMYGTPVAVACDVIGSSAMRYSSHSPVRLQFCAATRKRGALIECATRSLDFSQVDSRDPSRPGTASRTPTLLASVRRLPLLRGIEDNSFRSS